MGHGHLIAAIPADDKERYRNMARIIALATGLVLALSAIGQSAFAQSVQRIAAVVNEDVISAHDVEMRLNLVIGTSGFPDSPEVRTKLLPQVIRMLIDEKLKIQQAKQLKLTITEPEINSALAYVEKQNGLPPGGFEKVLAARGLDRTSALDQLHADVAWLKVVQRTLLPTIRIGEDEVDSELNRIKANLGRPERQVSEIYLPVDSPTNEDEVLHLAQRLSEQIHAGADFRGVARQFSQSPTAAIGGSLDWVPQGQLEEELDHALDAMKEGDVSGPIRTLSGYYILQLNKRRQTSEYDPNEEVVSLSQIFMPFSGAGALEPKVRDDMAQLIQQVAQSCSDLDVFAKELKTPQSGPLGKLKIKDLPEDVRKVIQPLPLNKPSAPLQNQDGQRILMVCERTQASTLPSREAIQKRLETQRLDIMAQRRLRDIRREAFLDVRL